MKRPDFNKQFERKSETSIEDAEAIARLAAMDHDEFVRASIDTWTKLEEEGMRAMIVGAKLAPHRVKTINVLIRFAFRCNAVKSLLQLVIDSGENSFDPEQSEIDEVRAELQRHVEELDKE